MSRPMAVGLVALWAVAAGAAAGTPGACCMPDDTCVNVLDEGECAVLGGIVLAGEDCATSPCLPGACCDGLNCGVIGAYNCIAAGRTFAGAGTSCFDDPCQAGVGACCFTDGTCQDLSPEDCSAASGTWLGAGTNCGQAPCTLGACCLVQDCVNLAQHECAAIGGTLIPGADCVNGPCLPECPANTLFGQQRDDPDDFIAGTSEQSAGFVRLDDYFGAGGAIEAVRFWGVDLQNVGGNNFIECVESDPTFNISFHADAAGIPGAQVCSYTVTATRTPTGIFYLGAELNEYNAVLPVPCVLINGWVAIEGLGDPTCWFLWMSAGIGGGATSWCDGCTEQLQDFDLAFCLVGDEGGVTGACCDEAAGTCMDGVDITDCEAAGLRFTPDTLCEDLDPPCGVITGACCFDDAVCSIQEETPCTSAGGLWLGANSICDSCPCNVSCPPGAIAEGEPVCFPGYDDQFNGGCDGSVVVFSPISIGDTICGISGVWEFGLDTLGDYDWYELNLATSADLEWSGLAEFPAGLWIFDGTNGCDNAVQLAMDAQFECDPLTTSASVGPGTYWLIVGPVGGFFDESNCGAGYRVTLSNGCPADLDGNGVVDTVDFLALLAAWGTPAGDINGDGTTDTIDFLALLAAWGPC